MSVPLSARWLLLSPLRIGGALLILLLGTAGGAAAQPALQLLDRVDGIGQPPREGAPLPESTRVVLLEYASSQPHTLPNANVSRDELSRRVVDRLEAEGRRPPLGPDGTTPWTVAPSAESGTVYYLLAETPDGTLYESYVNTGRGFVPGFDAVQSGRMTMGPVPAPARDRMRSALRVGREALTAPAAPGTTATSDPGTTSAPPAETTRTPDRSNAASPETTDSDTTADAPAASAPPSGTDASSDSGSSSGGIGGIVLGLLGGALLGGGAVWWWLSVRLRRVEEERADLQRTLRERQSEAFRSATDPGAASDEAPDSSELDRLREENAALRDRKETLEQQVAEIKERVRALREADA